ncbi:MAG: arylsulfatase [Planctomycetota bacterium]
MQLPRLEIALLAVALVAFVPMSFASDTSKAERPNFLVIYTDDIGFADISSYGGPIATPRIDELAETGRTFTRAHASSSTCTPSRYSLLTGLYPFRNTRAEILQGDAPLLIEPGSLTLASHLAEHGYHTAVIGKWHLGLGEGEVNWNGPVTPGPLEIGFDESYLMPATNDRVPCVYLDGHFVENLDPTDPIRISYRQQVGDWPTGMSHPELLRYTADGQHSGTIVNSIGRIGFQHGGEAALWVDQEMAEKFTERAIETIERAEASDEPWFVFFSMHQPHLPLAPNDQFVGKSGYGLRGDAILEADWSIGMLIDALDRLDARDDTLIIFSSDNGPVLNDGYNDGTLRDNGAHDPSGPYRGGKYTLWEAGTRVPFIASWPARIEPSETDELFGQVDLLASFAALADAPLSNDVAQAVDSEDLSPLLVGDASRGRELLVTQGIGGQAIQDERWKLIPANNARRNFANHWTKRKHGGEGNPLTSPQITAGAYLFDLIADPGETTNVIDRHPEVAERLRAALERIREAPQP